ncbi:uncharacterized protein LOC131145079 [Malania oleifera]|uniref:uncharacterized protein LOC131145079 n=1 Tax=Malania oleifera TaxID=397392 RepID=UPI0025ADE74D|nr:uncharacterized protein LOC131145079 [Malania oleifera]
MDQEMHDRRCGDEAVNSIQQRSNENSNGSVEEVVSETVAVMPPAETASVNGKVGVLEVKGNRVLGSSKVVAEDGKTEVSEVKKHSCVIDVKCGGSGAGKGECRENLDEERVCRICHLSSEQAADADASVTELTALGCGCKDELGIAHVHCAEAWFKLKGNRFCEICGQTAKNITNVQDNSFMEDWNGVGFPGSVTNSSEMGEGCWRGRPFCNFLMACLVIAFVLPWIFRVNMF